MDAVSLFGAWKFFPIFALLFGWGLAHQIQRSGRGSFSVAARLLWLLIFGALHVIFAWAGDILTAYAFLGIGVLLLARRPTGDVLLWAIGGTLVPYFVLLMGEGFPESSFWFPRDLASLESAAAIYARGTFEAITWQRISDFAHLAFETFTGMGLAFGMMLLGVLYSRGGHLDEPERRFHLRLLLVLAPIGAVSGAATLAITHLDPEFQWISVTQWLLATFLTAAIAPIAISLSYVSALALLWRTAPGRAALQLLAPAGRVSLTIYLSHSIAMSLVFYSYGLGWFGSVSAARAAAIALLILALQAVLAALWLRRFSHGPLEAVLRRLTR